MIRDAIAQLVDGISLDRAQSTQVMEEIMTGEATPAQIGAFTVALRQKGETVDEITGFAGVMREKSIKVSVPGPVLDTCGDRRRRSRHDEYLNRRSICSRRRWCDCGQAWQQGDVERLWQRRRTWRL